MDDAASISPSSVEKNCGFDPDAIAQPMGYAPSRDRRRANFLYREDSWRIIEDKNRLVHVLELTL